MRWILKHGSVMRHRYPPRPKMASDMQQRHLHTLGVTAFVQAQSV